jgi:phage terminase small subunit
MGGKGSGGHNRKPIWQHLLEGTYRQDRHGAIPDFNDLKMPTDIKPPRWFSPGAKAYFEELGPQLWKLGMLDRLSLGPFILLCNSLARYDELNRIMDSEGEAINNKLHPLSRAYNWYLNQSLRLFRVFGMTPAARHKLGLGRFNNGHN